MDVTWNWAKMKDLAAGHLHEILAVRQSVFVVEQCCVYQDADDWDRVAWHLTGRSPSGQIVAYLRVCPPGSRCREPSIGRLLTIKPMRGKHLASRALKMAIARCESRYPGHSIRIAAQSYLEAYYRRFGFDTIGAPYDEDGIVHIDMIRTASPTGST
jgi:ElaA protein